MDVPNIFLRLLSILLTVLLLVVDCIVSSSVLEQRVLRVRNRQTRIIYLADAYEAVFQHLLVRGDLFEQLFVLHVYLIIFLLEHLIFLALLFVFEIQVSHFCFQLHQFLLQNAAVIGVNIAGPHWETRLSCSLHCLVENAVLVLVSSVVLVEDRACSLGSS